MVRSRKTGLYIQQLGGWGVQKSARLFRSAYDAAALCLLHEGEELDLVILVGNDLEVVLELCHISSSTP